MRIGRKEALLALVATMIPWIGRRANAQVPLKEPATTRQAQEVADLQRRVAALEAQLATQVGFTKDAVGNLKLRGGGSIQIEASTNASIKAAGMAEVISSGTMTIRGSTININ